MPRTPVGHAPDNQGPPLSPLNPGSMHRAEDDAAAAATSPEFHERPASGSYTAPPAEAQPSSMGPDDGAPPEQ